MLLNLLIVMASVLLISVLSLNFKYDGSSSYIPLSLDIFSVLRVSSFVNRFIFVLLQTGTRGTFIGLVAGSFVSVVYIVLFATRFKQIRRYALGSLAALCLAVGGFMAVRDAAFIQDSPALSRIANINIVADLQTRGMIWGMSFEGIKERPVS